MKYIKKILQILVMLISAIILDILSLIHNILWKLEDLFRDLEKDFESFAYKIIDKLEE